MTARTLDPERLRRALALEPKEAGPGLWIVGNWTVHERDGCNCPDAIIRRVECKHIMAAKLTSLDPDIREALRELAGGSP